jgi:hypothetical protein
VGCANGRIEHLDLDSQSLPPSGGIPAALLDLTGLTWFGLGVNQLEGTIPSTIGQLTGLAHLDLWDNGLVGFIPSTIGQLTSLSYLHLASNKLTGSVPKEMLQLKKLAYLGLDTNPHLTGYLPFFDFSKFTQCCAMNGDPFVCPLPAGAEECVGGPSCNGKLPAPTCRPAPPTPAPPTPKPDPKPTPKPDPKPTPAPLKPTPAPPYPTPAPGPAPPAAKMCPNKSESDCKAVNMKCTDICNAYVGIERCYGTPAMVICTCYDGTNHFNDVCPSSPTDSQSNMT